jgi:hypothetical protein
MRFSPMLFALCCLMPMAGAAWCEDADQAPTGPSAARTVLEQMCPVERANSCISVEFESSDSGAIMLGRRVERLWNGGRCYEALLRLDSLEDRVGQVAIGNSWRKPVPTVETNLWGRDVRIGNRDSIQQLAFDVDSATGNLLVALRHDAGLPHFSVCLSTDGGAEWDETFTWSGSPPVAIDAGVTANHFYVAYNSPLEDPRQIRLRRFLCATGLVDTFHNSGAWIAPCTLEVGTTMRGISFTPRRRSGEVFILTLESDGKVLCSRSSGDFVSWNSFGVASGASNGLDATGELHCDTTSFFLSYYDASDTLRVCRRNWHGTKTLSVPTGRGTSTSISANGDTVICVYEDQTSSPRQVRYAINYGDGAAWRIGTLSSPDTAAEAPAVTACGDGRFSAVYRHSGPIRDLRFRQRTYTGPWGEPVSIADHEPCLSRPGIKFLRSSGTFGVVYLSNTGPVARGAWFDRSDWMSGIAEQRRLITDESILSVYPNPLSGRGRLSYTLNCPASLRLRLYDRAGRVVRELFDGHSAGGRQSFGFDAAGMRPGVYFIRADASGRALTVPVTVVK